MVELDIVHLGWVLRLKCFFQQLIFLSGQLDLLGVEDSSELLFGQEPFSEEVVVLEELEQSDSVFLHLDFNFIEQLVQLAFPRVINLLGLVDSFPQGFLVVAFEGIRIIQELLVLDVILFIPISFDQRLQLLISHCESEVCQSLSELFGRHLEMLVSVKVLKEALCI